MRCLGQGLESLKTFCAVMSLPNPVEQKSYDVINNKLSRVMKEVAHESIKRAAVEENSSSPDNRLTVSGDGTWKSRGHSSLIGVCTVIGAEICKVLDREVLSSFCKGCNSYKGVKFGIKYNKWQRAHKISCRKNYSGCDGKMEVDWMLRIVNRSEKLHNLKYSNYVGDGDTKTFNALSENKPYSDDHIIQKIECVGHVSKENGLISYPALLKKCLGSKTQNPNESLNSLIWKFCPKTIGSSLQIAEIAANLATRFFNDGNQILIIILEKFGLEINRNVCVSLTERDNRRIFTSSQRRLESSFEARRAKKIKKSKEIQLFQEQEGISYDPGAF
ncbi:uncharacterized protein TNCV_1151101 [Trichonephila clavipes]|nr:uncharacterized protein TNCV_1151101 [Trichonephila clavipes]